MSNCFLPDYRGINNSGDSMISVANFGRVAQRGISLAPVILLTLIVLQSLLPVVSAQSKPSTSSQFDAVLTNSWTAYKQQFIQQDGRVIDWMSEGNTTSEGQSYAMLRAVWM